jgi:predicted CXXCH cytochrome family protein
MKVGPVLLAAAAALFAFTLSLRAFDGPAPSAVQTTVPSPTAPLAGEFLGSRACARCHQDAFDQWERSLHIKMTKPIAEATVVGDFNDGTRFVDHGRSFEFGRANGKPFVKVGFGNRAPETFTVDYTLGAKRYQGYLSKLADGRIYVLPAFWHIESRRWVDWKEITPIPDGAHDLRQIWNTNCFNCHATNLVQGFDLRTARYETTWTEMGVGCEACHGPGRAHVELTEAWEKNPAAKPAYDNSASNRDLSDLLKIFSPRSSPPRQTYDTCAYCHGNKQNVFLGFRGGARYEDYALPFLISAPIPENDFQGEFWPDGRPNRFNRPQALTLSGCFKAGQAVCTSCHVAHGSRNPFSLKLNINQGRTGDLLCTQCHTRLSEGPKPAVVAPLADAEIEQHTRHKAASAGSRCIGCHMSDVNWRLLIRRRDHTFQPPVPEMTAAYGVPNSCTTCHDERSPEWAARQMEEWWGDGERRKAAVKLADTMYRAGSGDAAVLPDLARLAVDRSQGMLVRASAVEFMGRLAQGSAGSGSANQQSQTSFGAGTSAAARRAPDQPVVLSTAQTNALIGAASDPEPTVRAQAVTAMLMTGERQRVLAPLVARLVDPARVVRARAAEALLSLGIAQLPGAAGKALARAQDDYATALQTFPDAAANHSALAWLESERNRPTEATAAVDAALTLNPKVARPWVVKGVLAARAGRLDEAVEAWKRAKEIDPAYPNIDKLIEEAEKRK